jgi:hypothetical protein
MYGENLKGKIETAERKTNVKDFEDAKQDGIFVSSG